MIIHHIEQFKHAFGLNSLWAPFGVIHSLGKLGVVLFFTLSGFLITYLLLAEEKEKGSVDIRQFYMRRVLRIWPLYFLIFLLAFFVLNHLSFFEIPGVPAYTASGPLTCVLFTCFLSNYFLAFYGAVPFASQSWSVATEEQFYLVWPWLLRFSKNKLLILILVIIVVCGIHLFLASGYAAALPNREGILGFWKMFNIDCMAIGGIFAYLLFTQSGLLKVIINVYLFYFTILSMIVLLAFKVYIPVITTELNYDLWAVLFGIVILNLASGARLGVSLENKVFNYLGHISYGLYMYHSIMIFVSIKLLLLLGLANGFFILALSVLLTVLVSHLSYFYFEKIFLKLKPRFTRISSGG